MSEVTNALAQVGQAAGIRSTQGGWIETKRTLWESIVGFLATSVLGIIAKTLLSNFLARTRYLIVEDGTSAVYLATFRGENCTDKKRLDAGSVQSIKATADGMFYEVQLDAGQGPETLRIWQTQFMDLEGGLFTHPECLQEIKAVTTSVVQQLEARRALPAQPS